MNLIAVSEIRADGAFVDANVTAWWDEVNVQGAPWL
jgi:hypothetical protein